MSVAGFEDAYRAAHEVKVRASPPLDILVASPVGLTIMKLIAWADRPDERNRDAGDLAYILEKYLDVGNYERLLEKHRDLVEAENFDYVRSAARLLGRDIASIGKPGTIGRIREILAKETSDDGQYRLIRGMIADLGAVGEESENRFDELLAALRELMKGIEER
jgi:predicted nucleotidyltransferase